jgi:zinc transport system permease protein
MLEYAFMRRALLAGILLAIALPLVGTSLVLRRTSMTGDALSHASLAGVAGGLVAGVDPVLGALVACVIASLGMEAVRRRLPRHADVAIAVASATGAGLAGVLSSAKGNSAGLDSFLFGSIVAISEEEQLMVVGLAAVVVILALLFRREVFMMSLDEGIAATAGVHTVAVGFVLAVVTGVVVSIAARVIGSLVVSSMLVIPVAAAMQVARSYRGTIVWAVGVSLFSTVTGLVASYYLGAKPGGAIVLVCVAIMGVLSLVSALRRR